MRRTLTPELMDDPAIPANDHAHALRGLARLNKLSGADRILWAPILAEARSMSDPARPVTLLDLATGSGDVPLAIAARAERAGVRLQLSACDISETALALARERAHSLGMTLETLAHDAVRQPVRHRADIVISSLFLHHLNQEDAVSFLRNAAGAATRTLLISDLRRTPLGLAVAWAASRAVTRSPVVHTDAVKSVRAAYTPAEMLDLAAHAGLHGATVRRCWPWRMLLVWRRP